MEVANDETVLHPGDKAIVVADEDVLDDVRLAFRGSSGCGKGRLHVARGGIRGTLVRGCESAGEELRGIPIRLDSPRLVKQPTGLFQSLRNSLGWNTPYLLCAVILLMICLLPSACPGKPWRRIIGARRWTCWRRWRLMVGAHDRSAHLRPHGRGERAGAVEVALRWVHRRG